MRAISQRRGPPTLLRVDSATGRSWRKGLTSGGPWVPITEETAEEPLPEVGLPEADADAGESAASDAGAEAPAGS